MIHQNTDTFLLFWFKEGLVETDEGKRALGGQVRLAIILYNVVNQDKGRKGCSRGLGIFPHRNVILIMVFNENRMSIKRGNFIINYQLLF